MLSFLAKECGLIRGFKVGNGEEAITPLQFVDDTIIFCSAGYCIEEDPYMF